jgi:hypothetical protein
MSACRRLGYDEARSSAACKWGDSGRHYRTQRGPGGSMSIVTILIIVVIVLLILAVVGRGRF